MSHTEQLRRDASSGQAMTETLATLLAIAPLFVIVPYLGKYLDVKDSSASAARYAAWERTIWSDPSAGWNAGENQKDDATIAREMADRLLGNADRGIVATPVATQSRNTLWQDYTGGDLVDLQPFTAGAVGLGGAGASLTERTSPASNAISVETIAFGGPLLGDRLSALGGIADGFASVLDGVLPELGDAVNFGLDIGERTFSEARSAVPAEPLPELSRRGVSLDLELPGNNAPPLTFRQSSSTLGDDWSAVDEELFVNRIDGLVVDEPLKFIVFPGVTVFGESRAFPEGRQGADPDLKSASFVLPGFGSGEPEVVR